MGIAIVGVGMGSRELLTQQAAQALENCQLLLGSQRLLEAFPEMGRIRELAVTPQQVAQAVHRHADLERICVLVSGDVGFFSLTKSLLQMPEFQDARVLCGISRGPFGYGSPQLQTLFVGGRGEHPPEHLRPAGRSGDGGAFSGCGGGAGLQPGADHLRNRRRIGGKAVCTAGGAAGGESQSPSSSGS